MLTELNLSEEEILRLNYARYHYPNIKTQKKMHVIYIKATQKGISNTQLGDLLGIHRNTVSSYIQLYLHSGIEDLCKSNYHLTGVRRKPSAVRQYLHKHGFRYRKMGSVPGKVNPQKQADWLENTLTPYIQQAEKGNIHLLFSDAAHFTLSSFVCMIWSVCRIFLRTSHGRNRINVLGAADAVNKEVTTLINTTYITAQAIIEFLLQLKVKYPHKPIVMVLDNAKYQHCKAVQEYADSLNITLLFLPPYSPNLNIIERLWKFTKKKVLYARYYSKAEEFHNAIESFFREISQKHKLELQKLLTLKFQRFDEEKDIAQKCTA